MTGSVMRAERTVALALAAVVLACGRNADVGEVREQSRDDRIAAGMASLSDPTVVAPMLTPRAPGRIVYDPPPDLSLASARLRRPELLRSFRPDLDTASRAARASPTRDTTGGDGGMVRRRRTLRDTAGASRP
jgi:hypothetical protein